jgi:hypothetical protein
MELRGLKTTPDPPACKLPYQPRQAVLTWAGQGPGMVGFEECLVW